MPSHIRKSPKAEDLERRIRAAGRISASDLADASGVTGNNQEATLAKAIAGGRIVKELVKATGTKSGRPVIHWVWMGDCVPWTAERKASPHRAAPRKCLGCGREFLSTHAGNRLCLRCKTNNANNATPFDVPHEVRYH